MSERVIAALLENALWLAIGGFAVLYGYRVVGPAVGDSEPYDAWHRRWGLALRVLGPTVTVLAIARIVWRLAR